MRLYASCEQHVAGVVCRRAVGAEYGGPGGGTVGERVERRAQNGGVAGGDHDGGRPPRDMASGKKLLLRVVDSGGRSVWGGYNREQSSWGVSGASKDTIWSNC